MITMNASDSSGLAVARRFRKSILVLTGILLALLGFLLLRSIPRVVGPLVEGSQHQPVDVSGVLVWLFFASFYLQAFLFVLLVSTAAGLYFAFHSIPTAIPRWAIHLQVILCFCAVGAMVSLIYVETMPTRLESQYGSKVVGRLYGWRR